MRGIAGIGARFRAHPVATAIELGSFLTCFLLLLATVAAVAGGPPTGTVTGDRLWLVVIAAGGFFVLFWTLVVPLYERLL